MLCVGFGNQHGLATPVRKIAREKSHHYGDHSHQRQGPKRQPRGLRGLRRGRRGLCLRALLFFQLALEVLHLRAQTIFRT